MEARKLCPPETFSVICHYQKKLLAWHITIGDRKRGKILGKMEISSPLHRKAKILWQLENLQNYKDLYGKPLERDWRAKRLLLIQMITLCITDD